MLATIRRLIACVVLLVFIASFLPWEEAGAWRHVWWVERVQFVPALLGTWSGKAWAWLVLGVLLLLTLVFGRVFCSWLCPLGILQDAANRAARPCPQRRKGKGVRYAPNRPWLRGAMAVLAFSGLAAGSVGLLTWLDPYSIAARGMAALVNPLTALLRGDGAAPSCEWEPLAAAVMMGVAAFSLALPLGLAVWRGRLYCNTLCPVGAVLGLLSRRAPFTPHINASACGRCGACMKSCKAQAIDVKHQRVDSTRCVACYDCLAACSTGAMRLRPQARKAAPTPEVEARPADAFPTPVPARELANEPADASRRAFLGFSVSALATAALPELSEHPDTPSETPPAEPGNNISLAAVPPGAQSVERLLTHCTACGLCIANCPTQVLRPSFLTMGFGGFMKPELDFHRSFCAPDCTACSQACPVGALLPLSLEEKRRTQIGVVRYEQAHCLVWKEGVACARCVTEVHCPTGALVAQEVQAPSVLAEGCRGCRRCVRVCPAGAITMKKVAGREKLLAVIDRNKCIGCGACASACRPKAITLARFTAPRLAAPEKCIGCGACAHVCPTRRNRGQALTVWPRAQHITLPEA